MNHLSLSPSQYAYQVYELLAAHQVGEDLSYDGDRTISAAGLHALCQGYGTEITFPNPYNDQQAAVFLTAVEAPTAVAAVVEALLTTYASHLAFMAAEATQARLRAEVE